MFTLCGSLFLAGSSSHVSSSLEGSEGRHTALGIKCGHLRLQSSLVAAAVAVLAHCAVATSCRLQEYKQREDAASAFKSACKQLGQLHCRSA
jgi:hypothetical protein